LSGFDTNKNGTIEPDEVPEERRRMLEMMLERAGIKSKGPIRIADLAKGMTGGDVAKSDSKAGNSKGLPERLVPGFGTEAKKEASPVLAFGQRAPSGSGGASSRSSVSPSRDGRGSSSSSGSDHNDADARIKGFAQSMLRRYDRNHSGKLEKDEWGSLRGDPKEIDRDHNGVITEDELAEQLKNYSRGRSEESRSGDSRQAGSDHSNSDNSNRPPSYRFKTSLERLPDGLPDWFARSDANADGQVAMAEYSSFWDDAKVREFLKFDLNDDGLITPEECLEAKDQPESPSLPQGTSPASQPSVPATPGSPAAPSTPPSGGKPASGDKPWWEVS
jgi:hypothetical protein